MQQCDSLRDSAACGSSALAYSARGCDSGLVCCCIVAPATVGARAFFDVSLGCLPRQPLLRLSILGSLLEPPSSATFRGSLFGSTAATAPRACSLANQDQTGSGYPYSAGQLSRSTREERGKTERSSCLSMARSHCVATHSGFTIGPEMCTGWCYQTRIRKRLNWLACTTTTTNARQKCSDFWWPIRSNSSLWERYMTALPT